MNRDLVVDPRSRLRSNLPPVCESDTHLLGLVVNEVDLRGELGKYAGEYHGYRASLNRPSRPRPGRD